MPPTTQKQEDRPDLDHDHNVVGAGRFPYPSNQQNGQNKNNEEGGKVEVRMAPSIRSKDRSGPLVRDVDSKRS